MPVYLPTSILGNNNTLVTFGHSGEIMGWFYPHKDHAQQIHECLPAIYLGAPGEGQLVWTWDESWQRSQYYEEHTNVLTTILNGHGLEIIFTDVVPEDGALLVRRVQLKNVGEGSRRGTAFLYGDWNMSGVRMGNGARFDRDTNQLLQTHRDASLAVGGDGVESWQCGKAGEGWGSNARYDLNDGHLQHQDLEIGDVNWAVGFGFDLIPGGQLARHWVLALAPDENAALAAAKEAQAVPFSRHEQLRREADAAWLQTGLDTLKARGGELSPSLQHAYVRSLLALPLLCGEEGVAVAAPEFDPEFIACGGYGYFWPRDGAEYVSGLIDAGYPEFATKMFDWCAQHQDERGLWHQRYFLNGSPAPNWCLPPDMLQVDQVGAVPWGYGKWLTAVDSRQETVDREEGHLEMVRRAADYLLSRLTERDVLGNAFDTWETFVGSFTYSNASAYAALRVAADVLGDAKYSEGAKRVKSGVLTQFVRDNGDYSYLVRGLDSHGNNDETVDSSSLGAIEPFALLDLNDDGDLALAHGTLRAVCDRLETDWEGGRAIRRFEGDAYVGGVPACVNTLWLARCALKLAARFREIGEPQTATDLTTRAQVYLETVLHRATPSGLLPELMQGPTGQRWWAAPHGWAMASFVSGVLELAGQRR